ncbi:hypothetical protein SPI_02264 [Niveomyces insectorum RCEF 264]|uniref:Uncharacterized protein n=1 Tax=Niveomyces insectorum RCEF 264 TaxID=1081102 RepID=A0A167XW30_9HYPO|nr:hypothetical protein SPI_02264 [Niveomyces insectorum RCEF 264]
MEPTPASERPGLTEANLKHLQPSLVRPMSPMSISSGETDTAAETAAAADVRVARLQARVYNAMQTLVELGPEGLRTVEADELYIAGPGDVRLRGTNVPRPGSGSGSGPEPLPNLADPAFWEAKLRDLEAQCKPLCQARRKRRRLESDGAAQAAPPSNKRRAKLPTGATGAEGVVVVEAKKPQLTLQEEAEAQAEKARIEESRLLWLDKRSMIERWVQTVPLDENCLLPRQLGGCAPHQMTRTLAGPPAPEDTKGPRPAAASSDASVVEITSTQFSQMVAGGGGGGGGGARRRQRTSEAITTPAPQTSPCGAAPVATGFGRPTAVVSYDPRHDTDAAKAVDWRLPPQSPPRAQPQQQQQQQKHQAPQAPDSMAIRASSSPRTAAVTMPSDASAATTAGQVPATNTPNTSAFSPGAGRTDDIATAGPPLVVGKGLGADSPGDAAATATATAI